MPLIKLHSYYKKNFHSTVDRMVAGFTMIELMVTIAISAILVTIAAPSFTSMMLNTRQTTLGNAFLASLNYARSNALSQKVNTQVCPFGSSGSTSCGTLWSQGWIVTTVPSTGTGVLIQSYQTGPHDPTLSAVSTTSSIVFDTRGIATTQANFKICDNRGATYALPLQVIATGSVQLGTTQGTALWGGSLTCP